MADSVMHPAVHETMTRNTLTDSITFPAAPETLATSTYRAGSDDLLHAAVTGTRTPAVLTEEVALEELRKIKQMMKLYRKQVAGPERLTCRQWTE